MNGWRARQNLQAIKVMPEIISIVLGLFVGIVLALTGAGGAILSIPLLVFFLNLGITQAAPIGLFALMLSAGVGALIGLKNGLVRYKAAALMAVCGICLAPIGIGLTYYLPTNLLGILFAITLLYVAWSMWREPLLTLPVDCSPNTQPCQTNPVTSKLFWTAPCTARLVLTGGLAGLLSGLLGVGGGFVIVPALRKVSNFNTETIIATSLTIIALVSASGFLSYALHDSINWPIALPFAISTFLGMLISRLFTQKIPAKVNRRAFAVLAFIVAIALLIKNATI